MLAKSSISYGLFGELSTPPDKSISHRAIILSSLTPGVSYINNLLFSEDIYVTLNWAKSIGVTFNKNTNGLMVTSNIDVNTSNYNYHKVYLGNSGTSARLIMGVMAGLGGISIFYGDASLNSRPMLRVIKPLILMNASIYARVNNNKLLLKELNLINEVNSFDYFNSNLLIKKLNLKKEFNAPNAFLPVVVVSKKLKGITYSLNIPSAQVKSAILLAGLFTSDKTVVIEHIQCRDHTENMLKASGINLKIDFNNNSKVIILPNGKKFLKSNCWQVPGDFSSAAFMIVAALIVKGSHIIIKDVNLNPLRTGLLKVLISMGANINVIEKKPVCGEKFGNLEVKYTKNLKPIVVHKELTPLMIDEFPILSCLVCLIKGKSMFLGVEELRYKESDRISMIETNLKKLGITTISNKDSLTILGNPNIVNNSTITVNPQLDHRIAMSFLVLGLTMVNGIIVKNASIINTSFPNFIDVMQKLGASINLSK